MTCFSFLIEKQRGYDGLRVCVLTAVLGMPVSGVGHLAGVAHGVDVFLDHLVGLLLGLGVGGVRRDEEVEL